MYPNPEHRKNVCKNKKSIIKRHGSLILFNEHFIVISEVYKSEHRNNH